MPTPKIDPKKIFASQAPSQDVPAEFNNYERGWDESRKNNGKPTIKQFNKLQQLTDEKILWMHQNGAALPFDETMEYVDGAFTVKNGTLQQLVGGVWVEFLDEFANKDEVKRGIANRYDPLLTYNSGERVVLTNGDIVKSTVDGNTNNPNVDMTGWVKANDASQIFDESGLSQQEINKDNGLNINYESIVNNLFTDIEKINALNLNSDPVFKKSSLILPIDGVSIVEDAAGQVWVRQFSGVIRTSSFQNNTPLQSALLAAKNLNYDVIVDNEINLTASATVPDGVRVGFSVGGKVNSLNASINLSNYSSLENPNIYRNQTGYLAGVTILNNMIGSAIVGGSIESGTPIIMHNAKNAIINGVKMKNNSGYLIYNDGAENCQILNNICTGNSGWGIQSSGRQVKNKINNNIIVGDGVMKTGIITIASDDTTSSYKPAACYGNTIQNNTVSNISEEGISFDYDVGLNYRTVKSIGNDSFSQSISYLDTDETLTVSASMSIVAMNGLAAGHGILSKGGANRIAYTQPYMFRNLKAGDKIGLGFTALNNVISGNTVERCQRNGIMLYGGNTGTVVSGNTVLHCGWGDEYSFGGRGAPYRWGGIGVFSLSRARVAPTQGVIVTNNHLVGNSHAIDIGVARWEGTDLTPPANVQTAGNIFIDNGTDLTPDWLPV